MSRIKSHFISEEESAQEHWEASGRPSWPVAQGVLIEMLSDRRAGKNNMVKREPGKLEHVSLDDDD